MTVPFELQDFELADMEFDTVDTHDDNNVDVDETVTSKLILESEEESDSFHDSEPQPVEIQQIDSDHCVENENSLNRWKTLKLRTTEMKQVALNCSTLSHPIGDDVVQRLDALLDFLESVEDPCPDDFEFVDQRMKIVNELVGKAIDNYLAERKGQSSDIYKRIIKGLAACSVLVGFVAIVGEFIPTDW